MNLIKNTSVPYEAHTIYEFILIGQQSALNDQADDYFFKDVIDGQEYTVYDTIDSYIYQLRDIASTVILSNKERETYKYNPKLLSYKLYNSVNYYWLILRLNDMYSVYDFNLESNTLLLLTKEQLLDSLLAINKTEGSAMKYYNNTHKNLISPKPVEKFK